MQNNLLWKRPYALSISIWLILCLFSVSINPAQSQVWIDEDFDDSLAFNAYDIAPFHDDILTTKAFLLTKSEGQVIYNDSFNGSYAYRLEPGQRLAGQFDHYGHSGINPSQYIQFAVKVHESPHEIGVIGSFVWRWNESPDTPPSQSIYVKWLWNGSAVELIAGQIEPTAISKTIATLDDSKEWRLITIHIQYDNISSTDTKTYQQISPGIHIFCSDTEPALELPIHSAQTGSSGMHGSFVASGGAFLLDSLYIEDGMIDTIETHRALKPLSTKAVDAGPRQTPDDYPVRVVSGHADPRLDTIFLPRAKGWLGADAAYSVQLDKNHILWLFGDTLLGEIYVNHRKMDYFINNTIAIQDISSGLPGSIEYYWKGDADNPRAFFIPEEGDGYFWPGIGTMIDGELFLFLSTIYHDDSAWGFRGGNTVLIRVENPLDSPSQWRQTSHALPFVFNSALYLEDKHLYLMGIEDTNDNGSQRHAVIARASLDALLAGDYDHAFEFLTEDESGDKWGDKPIHLKHLFEPGVTETCIQFEPEWGLYFCTTYLIFTGEIMITTAPALAGPWSKPVPIYQIPEHHEDKSLISYAFKAHPELSSRPGEIVLTYAVNAFGVIEPVLNNINIYYPRFLRIQLDINH